MCILICIYINIKGETYFLIFILSLVIIINSKQANDVLRCNI